MPTKLSYLAPFMYKIDENGEFVKIVGVDYDFTMTNGELDEWAKELKSISNYMIALHVIKSREKMDKDTHVYCTDCIHGDGAVEAMMFDNPDSHLPESCKTCWPFDIPDSRSFEVRKNYVSKDKK